MAISNYSMACPPVREDNPRALASELSNVQVDKHDIPILHCLISVDLAHHEIFRAEVGKGGIKCLSQYLAAQLPTTLNNIGVTFHQIRRQLNCH